jgi:hypothetical protein
LRFAGGAFGASGSFFTFWVVSRTIDAMRLVFGLLAVTAAACGDDGNMFPVGGGGNDGGFTLPDTNGGGGADSAGDGPGGDAFVAAIDANQFVGRVCLLTDIRDFETCASTGAGGLTVRLGTATATTTADGSFTIDGQTGSGLVWRITGPNIVSTFEPLADYFIPAILKTDFDAMRAASADPDVTLVPGEGSMMVFVSRNGQGVTGATATVTPQAFYQPFYDGATEFAFTQTSTSNFGIVWVPGLDVGTATVAVGTTTVSGPIFDGGITFANLILP